MRDYSSAVADLLLPLVQDALLKGESDMLNLKNALYEYAQKVHETRENMTVCPDWRCSDCGRHWTAVMTVARERSTRPDNCPECYNKKSSTPSCWTVYRYCEPGDPAF